MFIPLTSNSKALFSVSVVSMFSIIASSVPWFATVIWYSIESPGLSSDTSNVAVVPLAEGALFIVTPLVLLNSWIFVNTTLHYYLS